MTSFTYMHTIAPKSWRDKILLTLWKAMLNGIPKRTLSDFAMLHSTQIAFLATSGYIKHEGDGLFSLTKVGQARLELAYKKLPTNSDFILGEVE